MCKIVKMFGVSAIAVLKWVRKEAKSLKDLAPHADNDVVMSDEMWHFVDGKKKIWVWRAIAGASRRPLGWELGTRDSTAKRLIERVDKAAVFLSLMTGLISIIG